TPGSYAGPSKAGTVPNSAGGGAPVATSIRIEVPPSITQGDQKITANVTVTAADGSMPAGQVTMSYSGFQGDVPFAHTLVNGSSAYTLYSLPAGTYILTAGYAAPGKYQASTATARLTVAPPGAGRPVATSIGIDVPASITQNDQNAR